MGGEQKKREMRRSEREGREIVRGERERYKERERRGERERERERAGGGEKGRKRERERERETCLLYTSPSPRDCIVSRMPSSA